MYLENLKIKNFRNYKEQDLDFNKNTIIVTGDNGNGKTNLLESIYYISAGRSHRTNKPEELISCDYDFAVIRATVSERKETGKEDDEKPVRHLIEIELNRNNSIKIRIDRVPYRRKSAFISILPSVIFSPDDLRIMKGSPSNRRNFLDGVIEKIQKDYQDLCNRYQKILNQRNSLLKSMGSSNHMAGHATLKTWDESLVKYGSEIILRRLDLIKEMQGIFPELMNRFFSGSETEVFYTFSWDRKNSSSYSGSYRRMDPGDISAGSDSLDLKRIKDRFSAVLKDNLADELSYKTTIIGPHRDDLMIVFDGKDIRYFGSQGQQRVAAICLRLFELEMLKKKLNKKPVLLLDDVLSELDEEREAVLLKVINKKFQTFITTAGRDVPDRKDADAVEKFSIVDNMVKKVF